MDANRSGKLILAEVVWKEKPGNGWLLHEVFDLLLRDPDLTDGDTPLRMQPEMVVDEEGGDL